MRRALTLVLLGGAVAGCMVGTSAARPARTGCGADQYRIELGAQGATQSLVATVGVALMRGAPACRLHTELTLAVTDRSGRRLAHVKGNPGRVRLDAMLRPGAAISRSWTWSNWCPSGVTPSTPQPPAHLRRRLRFVATAGARRASVRIAPVVCGDPHLPSTLEPGL